MINDISIAGGISTAAYQYPNQHQGQRRNVKIAIVGAGLSGIAAVKLFKETFPQGDVDLVIYEKNADVTGTWLENRYPGCACDVPAHSYVFSWEGNPNWSRAYVGAVELYEYYKGRADAYGVAEFARLSHKVKSARWNEDIGRWVLEVEDLQTGNVFQDQAEVFINAAGFLNSWKWPDIEGLQTFKGKLIHSARWDDSYDFCDRVMGIIGSGSSGIQITPQLQPVVRHMTAFIRSSTWITPEFAAEFAPEGRTAFFSERQKEEWNKDKRKFIEYRKAVESSMNGFFSGQYKASQPARDARDAFSKTMRERLLRKPEIADLLVPTFSVGCRRVTPGHGYLEALSADNVTVRSDRIARITADGVQMNNGDLINLEALVCATGFDTSFRPTFPVYGVHGQNLRDLWIEEPHSYLSIGAPQMPNYFAISGPNFPLANGCLLPCLEQNLRYAFAAVQKLQHDGIKMMVPKTEAIDDFQEYKDSMMKDLVWSDHCASWYKNGKTDGKVWGPWPGSSLSYLELMETPRWEDWDMTYCNKNRFHFLGNGRTERELTGGDLAYYVQEPGVNM